MRGGWRDKSSVLSIGKLGGGGKTELYYTQAVAQGQEDYYSGRGEAPGHWLGGGSRSLGLSGDVDADDLGALLRGQNPKGGALRAVAQDGAVSGFDLTFRAPKSVSILFGIGDDRVVSVTRAAHDVAVGEALAYLESTACRARRGKGGFQRVKGRGFVAAAFRHRTSRAGDPQLHTHVVVGNLTEGPDGRWTALDGRLVYKHAKTAGYLYQAALRAQLTEQLGVRWSNVERGTADIVGIPRNVIEHFSQRRAEIVELMKQRGEHSARAAQVATLETRRRKEYDVPVDRLREEWRARASEHGLDPARLAEILDRTEPFPAERLALARAAADLGGVTGLTRESSTFDRRDVLQAWAEKHRDGASVRDIELLTDAWLASPATVQVEHKPADPECPLYSTPEMLVIEDELVELAMARRGSGAGQTTAETTDAVLETRPDLSLEQAGVVRRLVGSGDGVDVVRAAAGTGKTYTLDAARAVWEAGGHQVFGCALSARAAAELRDQSGIPTTTITRLLGDLDHGHGFGDRTVLVVDEAGMVGTRAIAELARHAAHAEAKLVLVGDDHQLPEIEAGGAFRGLADRLGAAELTEVRRQQEVWDREALNALRGGDVTAWAEGYREKGRVVGAPDAAATRSALVADWWDKHREAPGRTSVMIALRRVDVADLNERARACMRAAGRLGDQEVEAAGHAFAVGDRVVTQRNDRRLEVTNGMLATVSSVDAERGSVTVTTDAGKVLDLESSYLQEGQLAHAYALTAHKAQGMTVDRAFVLGSDELYREWGYTALSRHREEARFYVTAPPDQQALPGLEPADDLIGEELHRTLGRSRAKEMALDVHAGDRPIDKAELARGAEEAARFQRELRGLQPPSEAQPSEPPECTREREAAEARLAESRQRLEQLSRWSRRQRADLEREIEVKERAVDYWRREEAGALSDAPSDPISHLARALTDQEVSAEVLDRAMPLEEPLAVEPPPLDDLGLEL